MIHTDFIDQLVANYRPTPYDSYTYLGKANCKLNTMKYVVCLHFTLCVTEPRIFHSEYSGDLLESPVFLTERDSDPFKTIYIGMIMLSSHLLNI